MPIQLLISIFFSRQQKSITNRQFRIYRFRIRQNMKLHKCHKFLGSTRRVCQGLAKTCKCSYIWSVWCSMSRMGHRRLSKIPRSTLQGKLFKVEIFLKPREVAFLSPTKICENLNFSTVLL